MSNQGLPPLPLPPPQYTPQYFSQLIRSLTTAFAALRNPGPIQGTTLNLSQLPTSTVGLRDGDIWNDAGVLKIYTAP